MVAPNDDGLVIFWPAKRAHPVFSRIVPMVGAVRVVTFASILAHGAHQCGRCPVDGLIEGRGAWNGGGVADFAAHPHLKSTFPSPGPGKCQGHVHVFMQKALVSWFEHCRGKTRAGVHVSAVSVSEDIPEVQVVA